MAGGRPTKYDPKMCDTLIERGKEGWSVAEVCSEFGIVKETFYDWVKHKPKFSDAFRIYKAHCQGWWERQGREGLHADKFQAALYKLNMVNRFGSDWKDKQDVTHSNPDGTGLLQGIEIVGIKAKTGTPGEST